MVGRKGDGVVATWTRMDRCACCDVRLAVLLMLVVVWCSSLCNSFSSASFDTLSSPRPQIRKERESGKNLLFVFKERFLSTLFFAVGARQLSL